jgi:hypothetical protein
MVHRSTTSALVAAALVAAGGIAFAAEPAATEPTAQELLEQIKSLQAKVEQLEAKQQAAHDDAEVKQTIEQIVADAEKRSALLMQNDADLLAGHEKGKFFLRSDDGNFLLTPALQLQVRYVANETDNAEPDAEDSNDNGFEIRRAKFGFGGHMFTPKLTYFMRWEASQNGGDVVLEDAWLKYELEKPWYVRGGQFKDPTFHEELVSSSRQLAVDRSLLNELLAGGLTDYIQAISAIYDKGDGTPLRFEVGYTDGAGTVNTNFRDTPTNDTDFGLFGRADFFAAGTRKQYDDFTALNNKEDLLVIGGGALWDQAGSDDRVFHTIDAQWENASGLSAYGAFVGQWNNAGEDSYDWGVLAQLGYLFKPKWEVFGRYDITFLDDAATFAGGGTQDRFQEFTVGVNHYIEGHSLKLTLDAVYLPDGAPDNETGIGILAGDGDEFVFRGQFQLLL